MDDNVVAAMAKWPNVPAAFGWLSLSAHGQWRLHPEGSAYQRHNNSLPAGEPVTSPRIVQFINRNYACDPQGRWFFQNGPQRVFVRLDAAPLILQAFPEGSGLTLRAHTGSDVRVIDTLLIDEYGRLYAKTSSGPGMVCGRDTPLVVDNLKTTDGAELTALPEPGGAPFTVELVQHAHGESHMLALPFRFLNSASLPSTLGFVALPQPDPSPAPEPPAAT